MLYEVITDMTEDIKILTIKDMVIMMIMDIILDILIELDIFLIIYSSYTTVNTHIMIDYIEKDIRITSYNVCYTKLLRQ